MAQAISKMETTAVEWLMKEWPALKYQLPTWLIEQAKAMEKEQIMKAVDRGYDEGCRFPEDMTLRNSEQYYNETYGGNDL